MEAKQLVISAENLSKINASLAKIDKTSRFHSRIRLEFLTAEAHLVESLMAEKQAITTIAEQSATELGISPDDMKNWSLDFHSGVFTRRPE